MHRITTMNAFINHWRNTSFFSCFFFFERTKLRQADLNKVKGYWIRSYVIRVYTRTLVYSRKQIKIRTIILNANLCKLWIFFRILWKTTTDGDSTREWGAWNRCTRNRIPFRVNFVFLNSLMLEYTFVPIIYANELAHTNFVWC